MGASAPGGPPRAVVMLSGGMDSATCMYVARAEGYVVHALSFDYGQRMARELDAARAVARAAGAAEHVVMPLGIAAWGGSALTDPTLSAEEVRELPAGAVPTSYIPARNLVFLSCALSYAEAVGAEAVYFGAIATLPQYPDTSPAFFVAFEEAARHGTQAGVLGRPIRIETPLLFLTKPAIVALGTRLGVDFGLTWSCYEGRERPCGRCEACRYRAEGFAGAGLVDPVAGAD